MKRIKKYSTLWLCVSALLLGLNIALCSFGIPVPGGNLYLTDVLICSSALIMDPLASFMIAGAGAFFGDMIFYPVTMLASLLAHGLQALIISYISKKNNCRLLFDIIGTAVGCAIMILVYGLFRLITTGLIEEALLCMPYDVLQALTGAVAGIIIARKARKKIAIE